MNTEEIEKKEKEKLDVSISIHETRFLNFLKFKALTILVTFKSFGVLEKVFCKKDALRNLAKFT